MNRFVPVLMAILTATQCAHAADSLHATLEFAPTHVLPGMQAVAILTLSNTSQSPMTIERSFSASVLGKGKQPAPLQLGSWQDESSSALIPAQRQYGESVLDTPQFLTVKPGEARHYYLAPSELVFGDPLFDSGMLSEPGSYEVSIALAGGMVVTNAARLVIDQPTGEDLVVWNAVTAPPHGKRWRDLDWMGDTAGEVARRHPASHYYPLGALLAAPAKKGQDFAAAIQSLLKQGPVAAPYGDVLEIALAEAYLRSANELFSQGNFDALANLTDSGRKVLNALSQSPQTEYGKVMAESLKPEMLSRKEWETLYRSTYQQKPKPGQTVPVKPLVQCKPGAGGPLFGYDNPNAFAVEIPVGERNEFQPAPADRGQMTVFYPGKHKRAFSVAAPAGKSLVWTLDGNALPFPPKDDTGCSDTDD